MLLSGIWHYLYNLKYVDDIHGWVLLLIKLQASVWNLLKVTLLYWCFLCFLHCTMVPNRAKHYKTISDQSSNFVPPQNTSKWKVSGRKPLKPNGYLNQDFGTMSFACINIAHVTFFHSRRPTRANPEKSHYKSNTSRHTSLLATISPQVKVFRLKIGRNIVFFPNEQLKLRTVKWMTCPLQDRISPWE